LAKPQIIVVDASVLIDVLIEPQLMDTLQQMGRESRFVAAEHFELECMHALRRLELRGLIKPEFATVAVHQLSQMPVAKASATSTLSRIWDLRKNFTAYDAAYVALALVLAAPLLTHDERLARAGADIVEMIRLR
jgi:predicted nucleic acid-binding protein